MKLTHAAAIALGFSTITACSADSTPQKSAALIQSECARTPPAEDNSPAEVSSGVETAQEITTPTESGKKLEADMPGAAPDELEAFLPKGATILSSATGDLNLDGRVDAVLVADPARSGNEFSGEGPKRILMLLVREKTGRLRAVKRNETLIPCEKCGGMAGDPFGYVKAERGVLTAVVEGGSPSVHWSEMYEFEYRPDLNDWVLRQVELGASDRIEDRNERKRLTSADLGEVRFEDFDRSKVPHPTTLL